MPNAPTGGGERVLVTGVSTRAMAESAARAGYRVTALDAFGDLDQHPGVKALSLPRDFGIAFTASAAARIARQIGCDAIAYLSPFENHATAVRRLADHAPLWGNGPSVLRRARDPRLLARLSAPDRAAERPTRWLRKPRASGGGHGIRWWTPGEPVPGNAHVQPFVDGTPASIVFVAARGHAVPLGLTRQIVGAQGFGAAEFRYCGSILAPVADHQFDRGAALRDAATALARAAARELDLVGVNCIDFIAHDGTATPIEINPRYAASMELAEQAYDISIFDMHAAACTTGSLPAFELATAWQKPVAAGKAIVFARDDVVCGNTLEWLDDANIRDVPHPGERIPAGRPVCTVFADGFSSTVCYAALVERASALYAVLDSWSSVPA